MTALIIGLFILAALASVFGVLLALHARDATSMAGDTVLPFQKGGPAGFYLNGAVDAVSVSEGGCHWSASLPLLIADSLDLALHWDNDLYCEYSMRHGIFLGLFARKIIRPVRSRWRIRPDQLS